jgi:hypothetical protein
MMERDEHGRMRRTKPTPEQTETARCEKVAGGAAAQRSGRWPIAATR